MQKGSAHLFLVIALFGLIFVLAAFFLQVRTPNYNSIANPLPSVKPASASDIELEKIYSNGQFGISFSYQSQKYDAKEETEEAYFKRQNGDIRKNFNYYVRYQPGEFSGSVNLVSKVDNSIDNAPLSVWIFNNPDNLDASSWFNKYWYYPFNWGQFESGQKSKIAPVDSTIIGGEDANFGEVTYQAGSPKYYYISKNGKMYLIRVLGEDGILDSLKFL